LYIHGVPKKYTASVSAESRNKLGNATTVKFAESKFARVKHGGEHGILSHKAFYRIQLAMLRFLFQESLTI
jgi:hypothetical protein